MVTSLDILSPQPVETERTSTTTAQHLEHLSTAILDTTNTRDFSPETNPIFTHLSPAYKSVFGTQTICTTSAQLLQNMREIIEVCPDFHLEMISVNSAVDEGKGTAQVWITHKGTGFPPDGLERESVKVFKWQRGRTGRWVCTGHVGLKGSGVLW